MFNCDYETYSEAPLAKVGAYRYAADPSAEILLAAVCEDDGSVELWDRFATPEQNAKASAVIAKMSLSTEPVSAFNAPFEIAVSTYLWTKSFGLPMPALERWRCSAALCRIAGMPSSLEKAAEFLKLPDGKDPVGKALIKIFSIPDPKTGQRHLPTDPGLVTVAGEKMTYAAAWQLFRNYCIRDVEVERGIQNRLKHLELKGFPLESFILDTKMNARGIPINLDGVAKAQKIVDEYTLRMGSKFTELTGLKAGQTAKVLAWLRERGYPGADLRASTVTRILTGEIIDEETGDETAAPVQPEWSKMTYEGVAALRVRSLLSFAALKKLPTMTAAACPDSKVHGAILYYGASRTGRSSGKLIQIQNFRRNTIGEVKVGGEDVPLTHFAYDMICSGTCTADDLEMCFGQPLEVIASSIRHFIHPKEGKFLDIDLAQIEARVLAWLSGHSDLLQSFREGKDLYKQTASLTFDVPYAEVTKDLRFLGKVVSLACIAGGQAVYTDKGPVRIEKVTTAHKVWDGAEFVNHDGVIYKGSKGVLTYQGLTATMDHVVYTLEGEEMAFWDAARKGLDISPILAGNTGYELPGNPEPLYDILNAGPRNRFTVSNVLVHNCGYAGGFNAFATMAKMFGVDVPEKRAKEIVKQYRKNNPAIKNFWRDAQDAAVEAIRNPGRWVDINPLLRCIVSGYLGFPAMVIELPSKRRIYYPYPEVHSAYKRKVQTLDADGEPTDKWIPVSKANALNADGSVRDGIWESDQISYYGAITAASWGRVRTSGGVMVENCLGHETEVLTEDGWMQITKVGDLKVFDGQAFVSHRGLKPTKKNTTIELDGLEITPEHLVLHGENWLEAQNTNLSKAYETTERLLRTNLWGPDHQEFSRTEKRQSDLVGGLQMRGDEADRIQGSSEEPAFLLPSVSFVAGQYCGSPDVAWNEQTPGVSGVEKYAGQVSSSYTSVVEELRCEGDHRVRRVDHFRTVLGGHGGELSGGVGSGPDRQRQGLLQRELPVDHTHGKCPQQEEYQFPRNSMGANESSRSRHQIGSEEDHDFVSAGSGYNRPGVGFCETRLSEFVYDLVDCGPRNRFVVRGKNKKPLIVHNCCQAVAADFLTHGVLNAEKEGYETIFVVHDQGLFSYRPEAGNTLEGLTEAFCRVPAWAPGFPLAAEGKIADYYSK